MLTERELHGHCFGGDVSLHLWNQLSFVWSSEAGEISLHFCESCLRFRKARTCIRRVVLLPRAWQGGTRWTDASAGVCSTLGYILLTFPSALGKKKKLHFSKLAQPQEYSNSYTPCQLAQHLCKIQNWPSLAKTIPRGTVSWNTQSWKDKLPSASKHKKSLLRDLKATIFHSIWELSALWPGENKIALPQIPNYLVYLLRKWMKCQKGGVRTDRALSKKRNRILDPKAGTLVPRVRYGCVDQIKRK